MSFTPFAYTAKIQLEITVVNPSSIPDERTAFGPQLTCRTHSFTAPPMVLDPNIHTQGSVIKTTAEFHHNDIAVFDIVICYLNYRGIIKTFTITNPNGDNIFKTEI